MYFSSFFGYCCLYISEFYLIDLSFSLSLSIYIYITHHFSCRASLQHAPNGGMVNALQSTEAEAISEMALGSDAGNDAAILLAMAKTNPLAYHEARQRRVCVYINAFMYAFLLLSLSFLFSLSLSLPSLS